MYDLPSKKLYVIPSKPILSLCGLCSDNPLTLAVFVSCSLIYRTISHLSIAYVLKRWRITRSNALGWRRVARRIRTSFPYATAILDPSSAPALAFIVCPILEMLGSEVIARFYSCFWAVDEESICLMIGFLCSSFKALSLITLFVWSISMGSNC